MALNRFHPNSPGIVAQPADTANPLAPQPRRLLILAFIALIVGVITLAVDAIDLSHAVRWWRQPRLDDRDMVDAAGHPRVIKPDGLQPLQREVISSRGFSQEVRGRIAVLFLNKFELPSDLGPWLHELLAEFGRDLFPRDPATMSDADIEKQFSRVVFSPRMENPPKPLLAFNAAAAHIELSYQNKMSIGLPDGVDRSIQRGLDDQWQYTVNGISHYTHPTIDRAVHDRELNMTPIQAAAFAQQLQQRPVRPMSLTAPKRWQTTSTIDISSLEGGPLWINSIGEVLTLPGLEFDPETFGPTDFSRRQTPRKPGLYRWQTSCLAGFSLCSIGLVALLITAAIRLERHQRSGVALLDVYIRVGATLAVIACIGTLVLAEGMELFDKAHHTTAGWGNVYYYAFGRVIVMLIWLGAVWAIITESSTRDWVALKRLPIATPQPATTTLSEPSVQPAMPEASAPVLSEVPSAHPIEKLSYATPVGSGVLAQPTSALPPRSDRPTRLKVIAVIGMIFGILSIVGNVIEIVSMVDWLSHPGGRLRPSAPARPGLEAWQTWLLIMLYAIATGSGGVLLIASRKLLDAAYDAYRWLYAYALYETIGTVVVGSLLIAWSDGITYYVYTAMAAQPTTVGFTSGVVFGIVIAWTWVGILLAVVRSPAAHEYWDYKNRDRLMQDIIGNKKAR